MRNPVSKNLNFLSKTANVFCLNLSTSIEEEIITKILLTLFSHAILLLLILFDVYATVFEICKIISAMHAVFYYVIVYLTEMTHIGLSSVDSGLDSGLAGGVHVL